MPDRIQSVTNASQFSCPIQPDDGSMSTVQFGENNLADVARMRNIDRAELLAANPQISGPYAPLPPGQEIHLPLCQAPALSGQPASADPFSHPATDRTRRSSAEERGQRKPKETVRVHAG